MGCIFADSFDHYSSTQRLRKWDTEVNNNGFGQGPSTTFGRFGTSGYRSANNGANVSYLNKNLPANIQTSIVGAAVRLVNASIPASSIGSMFFSLFDAGTRQVSLNARSDGSITVTRGTSTVLGTSAPNVMSYSTHKAVWLKVNVHSSTGTVDVVIDGVNVLSLTGQNTRVSANNYINSVLIGMDAGSGSFDFDDFFIFDTTGSVNNDFPTADIRWECLFPNATGDASNYTVSSGTASNYTYVDETPANDDTDYVQASATGSADLYNLTGITSSSSTIIAIQTCATDIRTDAGARTVRHRIRFGGGPTTVNGTAYTPPTSYAVSRNVFESSLPTATEVATMQAGPEVVT